MVCPIPHLNSLRPNSILVSSYVKEFVHGDLGRTSPSLGVLLARLPASLDSEPPHEKHARRSRTGSDADSGAVYVSTDVHCDILKLDVIQVDLVWPPSSFHRFWILKFSYFAHKPSRL